MDKQTGYVHIYCGDGKGKTTTGMGLCVRAAGYGCKVLIYQFMKDNHTSERNSLKKIPNITMIDGLENEKFSFQMTDREKAEHRQYYETQFEILTKIAARDDYDVLFLDELVYAIKAGLFTESLLLNYLSRKPRHLEVILTGQNPSEALIEAADYVSEIRKLKHPFDNGVKSRCGIEK